LERIYDCGGSNKNGPKQKAQIRDNKLGWWQDPWSQRKITQLFQPVEVQHKKQHRLPATIATIGIHRKTQANDYYSGRENWANYHRQAGWNKAK
jgi:hypothetical protein